jgi:heme-degrading monooxygenase HmoA
MVLTVFRSRLRDDDDSAFQGVAGEMLEIAKSIPGFVSYKVFKADDDERCTLVEFETEEALKVWREQADHRRAQRLGRERFYAEYSLQIGTPARESRFRFEE